jgi:hypothetical protein
MKVQNGVRKRRKRCKKEGKKERKAQRIRKN